VIDDLNSLPLEMVLVCSKRN